MSAQRVPDYIAAAPADQRDTLADLRAMITAAIPAAAEGMSPSGFPVYTVNGRWITGFASRKKGPMFYMMLAGVMAAHADRLGPLMSGKSCIEYRPTKSLGAEELRELVREMLVQAASELT